MFPRHQQRVSTPLSYKPQTFLRIFIAFLQAAQNFARFEKKD